MGIHIMHLPLAAEPRISIVWGGAGVSVSEPQHNPRMTFDLPHKSSILHRDREDGSHQRGVYFRGRNCGELDDEMQG